MKRRNKKSQSIAKHKDHASLDGENQWEDITELMDEKFEASVCMFTFVGLLAIYVHGLHPSVPGGDSGELIGAAYEFGVAHPPGYPLFTMTSKVFMTYLPWGSMAYRVNLLNAIYSAAAGTFLQLVVLRITRCVGSSLVAVALFSLSQLTWLWSETSEVFGLNNVFVAILMFVAVVFDSHTDKQSAVEVNPMADNSKIIRTTYLGAFLCGLSLCNQHTIVLYVVILGLWVIGRLVKLRLLTMSLLIKIGIVFTLGFTPYLYLPISSYYSTARWTWGDHRTLSGFLKHLFRAEYGTFDLGKDQEGSGLTNNIHLYLVHTFENGCYLGPILAVLGSLAAVRKREKYEGCLFIFIVMLAIYTSFFSWRANLDMSNPLFRGVVERFWMQSDIVLAVFSGVGMKHLTSWLTGNALGPSKKSLSLVFAMIVSAVLVSIQLRNGSKCSMRNNTVVKDFAMTLLEKFPENSIVFVKGDLPTNTMRYFHIVEGVRPDVTLCDIEMLTYGWALPMLKHSYPKIRFPGDFWQRQNRRWEDGRKSFDFKSLLDRNYNRAPIFVCIGMQDKDPSWEGHYVLWPYGPCHKVAAVEEGFLPAHWMNITMSYGDGWTYKTDAFPDTSWEKVANDEMWNAKIVSAFFMYGQAEKIEDNSAKSQLLQASYQIYLHAIKTNQKPGKMQHEEYFPSFWHKNFGLVCERLLYVDHHMSKADLCKQSIYHFQQYIRGGSDDGDEKNIQEAIKSLEERLDMYIKIDAAYRTAENVVKRNT